LPVFGHPLSDAFEERNDDTGETYLVQYFERTRMEHHPDASGSDYEVMLGRMGVEVLLGVGIDWRSFPTAGAGTAGVMPETGHAIGSEFQAYWSSHGLDLGDAGVSFRESLALFGFPISEPAIETNSSGDTVLTQWFERARFEHHPGNPADSRVLLGRLGAEQLAIPGVDDPRLASALAEVRRAMAPYHDIDVAIAAGFAETPIKGAVCVVDHHGGAMGVHYLSGALAGDDSVTARQPEALLYEPQPDGSLQLVGIEYFVVDSGQPHPNLFGRPLDGPNTHLLPEIPVHYALHAWLWRANPEGVFAPYNPAVSCPE
jgi:hypothetical protein